MSGMPISKNPIPGTPIAPQGPVKGQPTLPSGTVKGQPSLPNGTVKGQPNLPNGPVKGQPSSAFIDVGRVPYNYQQVYALDLLLDVVKRQGMSKAAAKIQTKDVEICYGIATQRESLRPKEIVQVRYKNSYAPGIIITELFASLFPRFSRMCRTLTTSAPAPSKVVPTSKNLALTGITKTGPSKPGIATLNPLDLALQQSGLTERDLIAVFTEEVKMTEAVAIDDLNGLIR